MIDLDTTTRKHLRIDELVEILRVSRRTIYYWIEGGKIPSVRIGGTIFVPVSDLRKLFATATPDPRLFESCVQSVKHAR